MLKLRGTYFLCYAVLCCATLCYAFVFTSHHIFLLYYSILKKNSKWRLKWMEATYELLYNLCKSALLKHTTHTVTGK